MRLVTYCSKGRVRLGALLDDHVVDLHRAHQAACKCRGEHVPSDLLGLLQGGEASMTAARQALAFAGQQPATEDFREPLADVQLLPPIPRPGKVVCSGLNYRSHLAEIREPVPQYPILFHKAATSLIGHGQSIVLPRISRQVDYEGELAVVIGRRGKSIPESEALSYVAGYTCANDVSAHDLEFRTSQWTSGKMLDTFCPLGPVLVTPDEIPNPNALRLKTILNGKTVQDACTSDMVFPVPFLVSYISSLATLEPGDLILTGTPAGIGCNKQPQVFLQPGDEVDIQIEGIGRLSNPVTAEAGR